MEMGSALEHQQYTDDIILWGQTKDEIFEKRLSCH